MREGNSDMCNSTTNDARTGGNPRTDSGFESSWSYKTADSGESSSSSDDDEIDGSAPYSTRPTVVSAMSSQPGLLGLSINNASSTHSTTSTTTAPAPEYSHRQPTSSTRPGYIASKPGSAAKKLREEERRQALRNHQDLIKSVKGNRTPDFKRLMTLNVDVNQLDPEGYTALHHAAWHDCEYLVLLLLENNADVTARTPKGYTPLMLAARKRAATIVEMLVSPSANTVAATTAAPTDVSSSSSSSRPTTMPFAQAAQKTAALSEAERTDAMLRAVNDADLATAARMIAAGGISVDEGDDQGRTMLALAAIRGEPEMLRLLLCAGADINAVDSRQNSPLMHAVMAKQPAAISALMAGGGKTGQTNLHGQSALSLAIDSNDLQVLQELLNGGVDVWQGPLGKQSPICVAASRGNVEMTKHLLQIRAYLPEERGSRTLAAMAKTGELEAVKTLLLAGADPHHKDWDGHTAFTLAAANGHAKVVAALISHCPANVSPDDWIQRLQDEADNQGRTALMLAVLNRQLNMAKFLLGEKADPHRTDYKGRNAILWAAAKANQHMVNLLIGYYATHVATDTRGNTVFLTAAEHGNTEALELFCRPLYKNSMFNINSANHDGDTPLLMAARKGHLEAVRLLLKEGADLRHCNKLGRSALLEAAENGHTEVLAMLQGKELTLPMMYPVMDTMIKAMVRTFPQMRMILPRLQTPQTRQTDYAGNSMMHLVASHGHHPLMDTLLAASSPLPILAAGHREVEVDQFKVVNINTPPGEMISPLAAIDIEATNNEGMTPLCMAARNGHYWTVKMLLEQGAEVNHADNNNCTPLWHACRLKACSPEPGVQVANRTLKPQIEDMVALLLAYQALPDQLSFKGHTPLIAASAAGSLSVVKLLIPAGAKVDHHDEHGLTPLMHASHSGHKDIVKTLLDTHASPDPLPGMTSALILAADGGHDEVVRLLIERGAQTNHVDNKGATALMLASKAGKLSTIKLLIERGADLARVDRFGNDAIAYASRAGHEDIVQRLQQGGLPPRDS
jgi:serine/threonine-protein phosphatase 6 regulatory ankyrin repeat subunit B